MEICSVGVLQLRDAGWHSGGTQGIAEAPNLRIVGCSIGGVVLPWLKVEEVSGTFPGSYLLLPWLLDLFFLHARVVGIDVLLGVFGGLGALGTDRMGCYALEGVDPLFVLDPRLLELGIEKWCWGSGLPNSLLVACIGVVGGWCWVWLGCRLPIISFALWLN